MQSQMSVLVIDDDRRVRESLASLVEERGYNVFQAEDGNSGLALLHKEPVDIVLADLKMPGLSDMSLVREVRNQFPNLLIICITGYGSVRGAVEAIKEGVYDYLTKPLDPDELLLTLDRAAERQRLHRELVELRSEMSERFQLPNIVGKCGKMREVVQTLAKIADSLSTVLIHGESGTGKELVARALHSASGRREKPFITIHCSSIPDTLLESELFGHEKGSFTGAFRTQIGKFELVQDGTIFLDDVGDISPSAQAKLLRVIQEREFMRLGSSELIPMPARVVAATNKDLYEAVCNNDFREDLFYRLNVLSLHLPPLRERREDIPYLTEFFVKKYSQANNKQITDVSPDVMNILINHTWPGNVRELENVIESAVVMTEGEVINTAALPPNLRSMGDRPWDLESLQDYSLSENTKILEKFLIEKSIRDSGGNKTRAAELLGISYRSLRYKIQKYEINSPPTKGRTSSDHGTDGLDAKPDRPSSKS